MKKELNGKYIIGIFSIIGILLILFIVIDYNKAKIYHNSEAVIIKKEFKKAISYYNPSLLIIEKKEEHYFYCVELENKEKYCFNSKSNLDVLEKIKADFKIGSISNTVFEFKSKEIK